MSTHAYVSGWTKRPAPVSLPHIVDAEVYLGEYDDHNLYIDLIRPDGSLRHFSIELDSRAVFEILQERYGNE